MESVSLRISKHGAPFVFSLTSGRPTRARPVAVRSAARIGLSWTVYRLQPVWGSAVHSSTARGGDTHSSPSHTHITVSPLSVSTFRLSRLTLITVSQFWPLGLAWHAAAQPAISRFRHTGRFRGRVPGPSTCTRRCHSQRPHQIYRLALGVSRHDSTTTAAPWFHRGSSLQSAREEFG